MEKQNANVKFDNCDEIIAATKALEDHYKELFSSNEYDGFDVTVMSNTRKAEYNSASITFSIYNKEPNSVEDGKGNMTAKGRITTATMYIVERRSATAVVFVNNGNHSVIFSNISQAAVDKSEKYIIQFIKRTMEFMKAPIKKAE